MNTQVTNVSAQSDRSHAQRIAAMGGKELSALLASLILKGEEVAAGPVTVLSQLRKTFVDSQGNETLTENFPRLGTGGEDDETDYTGLNVYTEFYKADVIVNGETKSKDANFFTDAYNATDIGTSQNFVLTQIGFAQSKTEMDKAEQAYRDMTPDQLANLKKRTQNAKSKGRMYLRKAIGVWYVMADLSEAVATVQTGLCDVGSPLVSLEYAADYKTNSLPFNLVDNTRLRMYRPMAVGDVMKLNVKEAIATPGHLYDVLIKQLARDTNKDKGGKFPAITNAQMFMDGAFRMLTFIDYETEAGEENSKAITEIMARKKGGDHAVLMVGGLLSQLRQLWTPEMAVKYGRLINEQLVAETDKPAIKAA